MNFEDKLRDELHQTAAAVPGGSIDFNEVLGRGHRARRRGIALMAAAAAVVVAIAVGGGAVLLSDDGPGPRPIPPAETPTLQETPPVETPPEEEEETEGVSFEDVEPTVQAWLQAIQDGDEDAVWAAMTPEAQAEIGREQFDELMASPLPEGMGAFADASDFHYVVVASAGNEASVVAVVSGDVEREGSREYAAQAFPVRIRAGDALIDEVFDDRYSDRVAVFASVSAGPFSFRDGDELTVEFADPTGAAEVYISVDDDNVPLPTRFDAGTGVARATLDRDLEEGRHIATVIVQHESGRLYPEAILFEAAAP